MGGDFVSRWWPRPSQHSGGRGSQMDFSSLRPTQSIELALGKPKLHKETCLKRGKKGKKLKIFKN